MTKIVKICGLRTLEAAQKAVEAGADLLGSILVPNKPRTVEENVALQISELARATRKARNRKFQTVEEIHKHLATQHFENINEYLETVAEIVIENGPFFVGVFRNQPIETVFETAKRLQLDFIQLHGSEEKIQFAEKTYQFGIIPRYVVPQDVDTMKKDLGTFKEKKYVGLPLLDSEAGGEGKVIDWEVVNDLDFGKYILAGGLNPANLADTASIQNLLGFDVSGGVEDGKWNKDLKKIEDFVKIGKTL
ncbi:phosphoribosylanthranilate isomerase [Scheffersomyces xylosifermentans]|uniref:phosphoribosylanthranilate isomerase n=1 Tax=Scheffersomyces xylosifermentans TaxID=1304137 RepID=UPI00315DEC93